MTSISESIAVRAKSNDKIKTASFPVVLILVYMVMEYARPANPLFIPMAISIILFAKWALVSQKKWEPQMTCFILLLVSIAIMVPFATNNFSAFLGLRTMAIQLICIAVPMMHFVDTLPRLALVTNRGVKVYPQGLAQTLCTDHWRCRFPAADGVTVKPHDVAALLMRIADAGFDAIKTENLYTFDGLAGYSQAQGE